MMGLEPTTFCMASRRSSQLSYIRVALVRLSPALSTSALPTSYATILIGVPTPTSERIRRMSRFATRTHPWDTACPSNQGANVP
jgi:hypothetical protein